MSAISLFYAYDPLFYVYPLLITAKWLRKSLVTGSLVTWYGTVHHTFCYVYLCQVHSQTRNKLHISYIESNTKDALYSVTKWQNNRRLCQHISIVLSRVSYSLYAYDPLFYVYPLLITAKWLRKSLVTGSCTFHNDHEGHRFAWWSLWSWLEDSNRDPVDMEIIRLHVTLRRRIIGLIHVCFNAFIIVSEAYNATKAKFTIPFVTCTYVKSHAQKQNHSRANLFLCPRPGTGVLRKLLSDMALTVKDFEWEQYHHCLIGHTYLTSLCKILSLFYVFIFCP